MEPMPGFEPNEMSREKEEEEKPADEKKPDTLTSKLRKMKMAGIAAAAIGIAAAQESPAHAETSAKDVPTQAEKRHEVIEQDFNGLTREMHSLWSEYGDMGKRSMQQETAIREKAVSGETARLAADVIANIPDEKSGAREVSILISTMSTVNAQGVVFREYKKRFGHLPEGFKSEYYGTHLRDFAPSASDIKGENIDPRIGLAAQENTAVAPAALESILENSGWATAERIKDFRRLSDDPEIRAQAVAADLTVAEYFSLLKATVKEVDALKTPEGRAAVASDPAFKQVLETEKLDIPAERRAELVAKVLLEKRETFARVEVLGASTKNLIVMTGRDRASKDGKGNPVNTFDGKKWNELAKAAHVPDSAVQSLDADSMEPKDVATGLIRAIGASEGETVVALDTHGSPESIAVSNDADTRMTLKAGAIAHALTERLRKSGNKDSLSQVTIILDSCSGYDFANALTKDIRAEWSDDAPKNGWAAKVKASDIAMPRIITMAQEGSVGIVGYGIGETLRNSQLKGIEKDGAITGKRLLQNVQPATYKSNDMTFFLPQKGSLLEIGANEQEKDPMA
jgi:hypothetical protein